MLQCKDIYMCLQAPGRILLKPLHTDWQGSSKSKVQFQNKNARVIQDLNLQRICNICKWPCKLMYRQRLRLVMWYVWLRSSQLVWVFWSIQHQPLLAIVKCDLSDPEQHYTGIWQLFTFASNWKESTFWSYSSKSLGSACWTPCFGFSYLVTWGYT